MDSTPGSRSRTRRFGFVIAAVVVGYILATVVFLVVY